MRLLRLGPSIVALASLAVAAIAVETARADSITATCTPGPCGTWQATNVKLTWDVQVPAAAAHVDCGLFTITQEGTTSKTCTAVDLSAMPILFATVTISIDKTSPKVIAAVPEASPNLFGWHTSPFGIVFQGADSSAANAASGIAACTQASYSGPDTPDTSIAGTCRDRAGNVSTPLTYSFKYDATSPALAPVNARADDRAVTLRWTRSEAPVEIARTPGIANEAASVVYRGPAESFIDTKVKNGITYQYRATVVDAAGHAAIQTIRARPSRGLLEPANGARVTSPPRLTWTEIRNADYYNVQIYRGSKKVLSVWPKKTVYALRSGWRFQGHRVKLAPGAYRVFVWPGFGALTKQRYGRIVGSLTFVVRPR